MKIVSPLNHRSKLKSLLIVIVIGAPVNTATVFATDNKTISLQDAVSKTLQHNLELQAFDYQLKAQESRVLHAELAPGPELSIEVEDVLGSNEFKGVDSAQTTISIGWVLEGGIRQHYIETARAGSSLLASEVNIKKLDTAAETARRFIEALAYQARMVNADKTVQLAEDTIEDVKKRVAAGRTPEAELARAKAELARRKLEREDIEHELKSSFRRLAAQWGESTVGFSQVAGNILHIPKVGSFEDLKPRLQHNPEFERLLSDQRLKKSELALQLAQKASPLRVTTGIRHRNNTGDQAFLAGITIPFGERTKNKGPITEARAKLEKTQVDENAARIRIETRLYVMYEMLQHSLHVIETVRNEIIPPLDQALEKTRRAYNLGRYSYLEWRSFQADLLNAHNMLIEASIEAHQHIIEIERLTGVQIAQQTITP